MRPAVRGLALGALLALVLGSAALAGATTLPTGFSQEVVATGLFEPTGIAFFPDGRIAIAQKQGAVRLVKNGALLPTPLIDITSRVSHNGDHGLLGIAVDPNFPSSPYVYLLYVYENDPNDFNGTKTSRLTRVTVVGDTASAASEIVLVGSSVGATCKNFPAGTDCIPADGPSHSVGSIRFASDGTMFITSGDASGYNLVDPDPFRVQDLDSLAGKMLHITKTGQGLPTNPFWNGNPNANRSKVWVYGLRNAFRFGLRPGTDVPYLGDVGWNDYEEINVAKPGANLGWPCFEGPSHQPGYAALPQCEALFGITVAGSIAAQGTPIAKVPNNRLPLINDGVRPEPPDGVWGQQYDSWDGANAASDDWVGYTFPTPHTFNRVVFEEGQHFSDGGWFLTLTVQVRQNGQWVGVSNLVTSPAYPGNNGVSWESFALTFDPIQGDGIRIYGAPGGSAAFISVAELDVFEVGGGGSPPVGQVNIATQAAAIIARVPNDRLTLIDDGVKPSPPDGGVWGQQYDSYHGTDVATEDWIGYTFSGLRTFNRVVFQEGQHFSDGGWFLSLTVQVRQNGQWIGVSNLVTAPASPGNNGVNWESFTLTFDPIQGDGIRIYGVPGGSATFISVAELEVYEAGTGGGQTPPPAAGTLTMPLVSWPHAGAGAAVIGGAFYTGTLYPSAYQGAYFYGDYAEDVLRTLRVDAQDNLVPGSVTNFAAAMDGVVDIQMGPDGLIYYVALTASEVRRIRYTAGNTPPVAVASANPSAGLAPLAVQFSSSGSNDPDGDPITFGWNFGDGSTGTGPSPQHTYQLPNGTKTAVLTVRDNHGGVATATVPITVGNRAPTASISSPAANLTYKVGDTIAYAGSASDPDQGTLPASALFWQVVIHHCPGGVCHLHPQTSGTGASGSFTVPDHGDDSYLEFILTATDAGGLTNTVSRTVQPANFTGGTTACPVGQYQAQYFNNTTLSGTPVFTRCETTINYNWGTGGPGNGIGTDNFSVRWTGRFTFPAGPRTFTTVSDDGVRMWVDTTQIIDNWTDHWPFTNTATRTMTAGDHDVKVEYHEKGGGAVIQVSW